MCIVVTLHRYIVTRFVFFIDFQDKQKKTSSVIYKNSSYCLFYPSKSVSVLSPVIVGMVKSKYPSTMVFGHGFMVIIHPPVAVVSFTFFE